MSNTKTAIWFLKIGLAFVFAYAAVEMYLNPQVFLKYTPAFIFDIFPKEAFLYAFGFGELLLAGWILTNWKLEVASIFSVLLMVGIMVFNMEHFQILFRNVAIAFGGLALFMLTYNKNKQVKEACLSL